MHLEILVEDRSGEIALRTLVPKIIGPQHTFRVISYRGIGRLPPGLRTTAEPRHRALLSQLPRLLRGYGTTFNGYGPGYAAAIVLVCDLDQECRREFRSRLIGVLEHCRPRPACSFCIAEEEMEAWFLGDRQAISSSFGSVKSGVLEEYVQDSNCGTWELLADAVYPGGAQALRVKQYLEIGTAKCEWAKKIALQMNVDVNESKSFRYFRDKLRNIVGG